MQPLGLLRRREQPAWRGIDVIWHSFSAIKDQQIRDNLQEVLVMISVSSCSCIRVAPIRRMIYLPTSLLSKFALACVAPCDCLLRSLFAVRGKDQVRQSGQKEKQKKGKNRIRTKRKTRNKNTKGRNVVSICLQWLLSCIRHPRSVKCRLGT